MAENIQVDEWGVEEVYSFVKEAFDEETARIFKGKLRLKTEFDIQKQLVKWRQNIPAQ